jgi:hypothetical protein
MQKENKMDIETVKKEIKRRIERCDEIIHDNEGYNEDVKPIGKPYKKALYDLLGYIDEQEKIEHDDDGEFSVRLIRQIKYNKNGNHEPLPDEIPNAEKLKEIIKNESYKRKNEAKEQIKKTIIKMMYSCEQIALWNTYSISWVLFEEIVLELIDGLGYDVSYLQNPNPNYGGYHIIISPPK